MKKIYKWICLFAVTLGILFCRQTESSAASENNISVTVPSNLNIIFQSDGTNSINQFQVKNESPVPIKVKNMKITEHNQWQLVDEKTPIQADQKKLTFLLEGQSLQAGNNSLDITVPEHTEKKLAIEIRRGAWNRDASSEKALAMELEYAIGTKNFRVTFDSNGSKEQFNAVSANNGSEISLPTPFLVKHNFLGWEDENGTLYNETYLVPMQNVTLKAKWQRTEAYAIFCAEDKSLRFVRSVEPILPGDVYKGKVVSEVYQGIEEDIYDANTKEPWIWAGGVWGGDITTVIAEDVIQPKSTAYWFFSMDNVAYMDLTKLDMSQVEDMISMFSGTGIYVTDTFTLKGIGQWDTSNIRLMGTSFRNMAMNATTLLIDDISGWDTSSAEDMYYMFVRMGQNCSWHLDLSSWNVNKTTRYDGFSLSVESKIDEPHWVH